MKLVYKGHAKSIHIRVPVGTPRNLTAKPLEVFPNIPFELSDEDGAKLLLLNPNGKYFKFKDGTESVDKAVEETSNHDEVSEVKAKTTTKKAKTTKG